MKKVLTVVLIIIIALILAIYVIGMQYIKIKENDAISVNVKDDIKNNNTIIEDIGETKIDDWRIMLINYENSLPDDFEIELASIDNIRKFDKRAINELLTMMKDARNAKVSDMWVQSAYRSIEYQQGLFDKKISKYMAQGRSRKEAENLTLQTINRPGTSEHNLGLAVDFNYVNYNFENTKAFGWLQENAENYGFILRYRKDKEDITKVDYEPWHWRYVGVEHAKKINELDMCLEEYVKNILKN